MSAIEKHFGGVLALGGVHLEVAPGEVHALVGENGAGKSTLMKVLSGALQPDAGTMEIDGARFAPAGPLEALECGVAMIYQELNLAPHLTVEQNVMLGREQTRRGRLREEVMREQVVETLRFLGREDLDPGTRVSALGPGPRQLVEIARALVGRARILVMDEPTSSLSREDTVHLFDAVGRLRADGVAVIYISHFLEEVQQIADRFTVLRDGTTVGSGVVADSSLDEIIGLMVGRALDQVFPHVPHEAAEVVLHLEGLAGRGLPVDATLVLRRGEVLGIAGLVGAGRTELLRAVMGLDPVRRGTVRVAGVGGPVTPRARWGQGVGYLSEDRKDEGLALGLSVADNATLSRLGRYQRWGWLSRRAQGRATESGIEALGVRCQGPWQPVGDLSGGNQQKIALLRLLHQDVDVLLLDEPTKGIDVGSKVEIYRLLQEQAAAGKAVLMVSSYIPELLGVCDRIAVMHRGRLGPARSVRDWDEHRILDAAVRGEASS